METVGWPSALIKVTRTGIAAAEIMELTALACAFIGIMPGKNIGVEGDLGGLAAIWLAAACSGTGEMSGACCFGDGPSPGAMRFDAARLFCGGYLGGE